LKRTGQGLTDESFTPDSDYFPLEPFLTENGDAGQPERNFMNFAGVAESIDSLVRKKFGIS